MIHCGTGGSGQNTPLALNALYGSHELRMNGEIIWTHGYLMLKKNPSGLRDMHRASTALVSGVTRLPHIKPEIRRMTICRGCVSTIEPRVRTRISHH